MKGGDYQFFGEKKKMGKNPGVWIKNGILYTRYPTKDAIPLVFPEKGAEKDENEEKEVK